VAQIVPLPTRAHRRLFTEADLAEREFTAYSARRLEDQSKEHGVKGVYPRLAPTHAAWR
jgi:hypothetical protein